MTTTAYTFGSFQLHPAQRVLLDGGREVPLPARAFDLLRVLAAAQGELVSKAALLAAVWPGLIVEENNLQVQISHLRKTLGHAGIRTVPGRGYRLAMPFQGTAVPAAPARQSPAPLYGREDDLDECIGMVGEHRLVSILGGTGVGKTALARQLAASLDASFDGHVTWVDLTEAATALDVAAAVGVPNWSGKRALLVLDNADRVSVETAGLARRLLAEQAGLHLLVTTQVRLNLMEESVYRLPALAVPTAGTQVGKAMGYGALALLQARVAARDHHFVVDEGNVADAIGLCRRLDGLPLALELAAARVPAFGLRGLSRLLDEGMFLLSGGMHAAPRHRAMHAALDWSYQLLRPAEQALYCDIARLPGWFSLEQVADRARGRGSMLDALDTLVDRALVIFDATRSHPYTLTETGRMFALAKRHRKAALPPA